MSRLAVLGEAVRDRGAAALPARSHASSRDQARIAQEARSASQDPSCCSYRTYVRLTLPRDADITLPLILLRQTLHGRDTAPPRSRGLGLEIPREFCSALAQANKPSGRDER